MIIAAMTPVTISHMVVTLWFIVKIPLEGYRLYKSKRPMREAVSSIDMLKALLPDFRQRELFV